MSPRGTTTGDTAFGTAGAPGSGEALPGVSQVQGQGQSQSQGTGSGATVPHATFIGPQARVDTGFLGYYQPPLANVHDEMVLPPVNASGTAAAVPAKIRPQWHGFLDQMNDLGGPEVMRRWETARSLFRENGVTYNVYSDPQGMDRPWEFDPVPFIIGAEDWAKLEAGLIQRARLFDLILRDLYGPRRLLRDGLLPPALVFANSGYLRPLHGLAMTKGPMLHFYAADLARSPDGRWWVLDDRTQAPSGAGYALENRTVLSRMLPDVFRACDVHRLSGFFDTLHDTLLGMAPRGRDNPRIVLLTPGPYNEVYFEHAYLARYLGYTLVEGSDLTVRDNHVFLKTLSGLQPVHVILRRVDEDFCDPMELRSDSSLGVAGLVQAAAAGNVAIANCLGCGVIETPAIRPFLIGLARSFLGEPLKLPSVATWWCGQKREMNYVLEHLDDLVVRPTFGAGRAVTAFAEPQLTRQQKADLSSKIRFRPHDFTGHERVQLSSAPALIGTELQPRAIVLRVYLVSSGDSYVVMPGGLTRVSSAPDRQVVSMQRGDGSKDTWVLSDKSPEEEGPSTQPQAVIRLDLKRSGTDMASRVADNLFWLGRYAERSECIARLFRVILTRYTDETASRNVEELRRVLQIPVSLGLLAYPSPPRGAAASLPPNEAVEMLEKHVLQSIFESHRGGSLHDSLHRFHHAAVNVRDRLSSDMWRIVSKLDIDSSMPDTLPDLQIGEALGWLNDMIVDIASFSGMVMENMTRGLGWRFMDMGRRLERALYLLKILRRSMAMATGPLGESFSLEALLDYADSSMTHRSRYFAEPQAPTVLDLVLCDESNPRSVAYQIAVVAEHINNLPRDQAQPFATREKKIIMSSLNKLRLAEVTTLCECAPDGGRPALEALIAALSAELPDFSDSLTQDYFSHAAPTQETSIIIPDPR
ncbi:hypothetical protein DB346_23795 [Verrucomicrobia bacterium LW23]|nr:hypothetical protein DB346_23795 [Verrucomicrobia bacterium LW23]